jgi:hypothetical protein
LGISLHKDEKKHRDINRDVTYLEKANPLYNAAVQQTVIAMASPLYNRLVVMPEETHG